LICAVCIEEVDRAYKTRRKIREAERFYFQAKRNEVKKSLSSKPKKEENKDGATENNLNVVKQEKFETIDDLIGELSKNTGTEMQKPSSSTTDVNKTEKQKKNQNKTFESPMKLSLPKKAMTSVPSLCTKSPWISSKRRNSGLHHLKVRSFSCDLCDSKFFTKRDTKLHIVRHIKNPNLKPRNRRTDDVTRPFKCTTEDCSKYFKTKLELNLHQRKMHQNKISSFESTAEAQNDAKQETSSASKNIKTAKKRVKRAKQQLLKCPICPKTFSSKCNVSQHIKFVHEKVRKFNCDFCGLKLQSSKALERHIGCHIKNPNFKPRPHYTDDSTRPFKCDDCLKYFKTKSELKQHQRVVHKGSTIP
jgi:Zinc finger, C2H2 type/C2H2-type zinc finger